MVVNGEPTGKQRVGVWEVSDRILPSLSVIDPRSQAVHRPVSVVEWYEKKEREIYRFYWNINFHRLLPLDKVH